MCAMSIRIVFAPGPSERVKLLHPALEGGMYIRRGAFVESGIGHSDNLASAFATRNSGAGRHAQHLARDAVCEPARQNLLDVPHLIERGEIVEPPDLYDQTRFDTSDLHIRLCEMRSFRDPLRDLFRIDVPMQNHVDSLPRVIELAGRVH